MQEQEEKDREFENSLDNHLDQARQAADEADIVEERGPEPPLPDWHRPVTAGANNKLPLEKHESHGDLDLPRIEYLSPVLDSGLVSELISRRVDCYETITDWLSRADYLFGFQYGLAEQKFLS